MASKKAASKRRVSRSGVTRVKKNGAHNTAPHAKEEPRAEGRLKNLSDLQWPMQTRSLFRPDRYKYIMGETKTQMCVFCSACAQGVSKTSLMLHGTKHSMVLLNKFPYNVGHLLVLPRQHQGDLLALSNEEFLDLQNTVRASLAVLKDAYKPSGVNLGMNLGRAAGAGIPEHLHYHIVPRWEGDLNFFPLIGQSKTLIETLEQTFERLLPYYK